MSISRGAARRGLIEVEVIAADFVTDGALESGSRSQLVNRWWMVKNYSPLSTLSFGLFEAAVSFPGSSVGTA